MPSSPTGPTPRSSAEGRPHFVDEHRVTVDAPRDAVWAALRHDTVTSLTRERSRLLIRLLRTEPRSGFALAEVEPGTRLALTGRHRFSRYLLVFELADAGAGRTEVTARTFADFPGLRGRVYEALVIGSRAHVLAVRALLRSVGRSAAHGATPRPGER